MEDSNGNGLHENGIIRPECIIVDKVFDSCKQKECFPTVEVDIDDKTFDRIRFRPGFIVPNTLIVTDIPPEGNDFRRVRFTLRIPFIVFDTSGNIIKECFLPDIYKDIVLYIPEARDEFDFRIVVETLSDLLSQSEVNGCNLILTVGTYVIVKVVGTVQLLIPAFGYCPPPNDCVEFNPEDVCDYFFYNSDFPDFFPEQLPYCPPDL